MQAGDKIYLINSSDTSKQINQHIFHDFKTLQKEIDRTEIEYRPSNLTAALHRANTLLQKSNDVNKEVYIVSDLQKNAFTKDSVTFVKNDVRYAALPIQTNSIINLSINEVKFVSTILEKDRIVELNVFITNRGNQPARNKLVQLFVSGNRVAQSIVDLNAGASITENFKFILDKSGFVSGYFLLEDDDLLSDNKYYFSFHIPDQIRIGMVGFSAEDNAYLSFALVPNKSIKSIFDITDIPLEKFNYVNFDDYDVLVLSNIPQINSGQVEKIREFVKSGGGLLLLLGDNIDIRDYNSGLCRQLNLPGLIARIGSVNKKNAVFSLKDSDITHPIFYGIFESENARFKYPQFYFAIKVAEKSNMIKIMDYSSGDPFLFETKLGQGSVLVATTGFKQNLSNISHSTIFAPLMSRSLSYLGNKKQHYDKDLSVNDDLLFRLPVKATSQDINIVRPDNKVDRIQPETTAAGVMITYNGADIPGQYNLLVGNEVTAQWSVNPDTRESDLTVMDRNVLKDNYGMAFIKGEKELAGYVRTNRFGRELWKYFVILAFVLLVIEMLVYREKGEVTASR